jgi:hypothetical protein
MGDILKKTDTGRTSSGTAIAPPLDSLKYVRMARREGYLTLDSYHPPSACLCDKLTAKSSCPARCRPAKLGIIGDSIVGSYNHLYPRLIQKALRPHAYEIHSSGRVGDSAHKIMGLTRFRGGRHDVYSDWLKDGYDDLVLALGVNAIADGVTAGGLFSIMREMCEIAMEAGIRKITLVEIAPWGGHRRWTPEKQAETLKYNEMLGVLAMELNYDFIVRGCDTEVEVVRVYYALEDETRPGYSKYPRIMRGKTDRLHPSEQGIRIIADEIMRQAYPESI